jgi:hypothetical protein
MPFNTRLPLLILAITAIASSRTLLVSFNDPEGPNPLIIIVLAAVLYAVSMVGYASYRSTALKKTSLAILIQILSAICLYFLLR